MVRPEFVAVECERPRCERNRRQILDLRPLLARIKSRDAPYFGFSRHIFVLAAADHIEHSVHKRVPADLCTDVYLAQDLSMRVILQQAPFVPLAQVKVLAIKAEIRAGEIRTRKQLTETVLPHVTINEAIVVQSFADGEPPAIICQ